MPTPTPTRHPVAIVTGSSRGLGRALAEGLASKGWPLVLDARHGDDLAPVAAELAALTTVVALAGDVTDPDHRRALAAAAHDLGGAALLVNNASRLGPSPLPPLATHPIDELGAVFATNVVAPVALTQLVLPQLEARDGAVVNVTSDAAVEAYPGWGGYGSSKAALEQVSAVLAAEHPALRVWWVDPGDLRTQMHQDAFPGEDITDRPLPETVIPAFLRLVDQRPPSGRVRALDLLAGQEARP